MAPIVAVALLAAVLLASPLWAAGAGKKSLDGSWETFSVIEATGEEVPILLTFNADGTYVATGPREATSVAHGVWEKVGPRTFLTTSIFFIYDQGEVAFTGKNRTRVELSTDGESFAGVFETEIRLPYGPVVDLRKGGTAGTRIKAEPF